MQKIKYSVCLQICNVPQITICKQTFHNLHRIPISSIYLNNKLWRRTTAAVSHTTSSSGGL